MKPNIIPYYFKNIVSSINEMQSIDHTIHEQEKGKLFLNFFFILAKRDFESDVLLPNRDLLLDIRTHLPTKIVHEVLLYTWKDQHTIEQEQVHDNIKDGTISILQMIRTPQEYRKCKGFKKTVLFWWVKPMNKWRKIMHIIKVPVNMNKNAKEFQNSYCLIEKIFPSKYLNELKKYDFLSKNIWFKSTG